MAGCDAHGVPAHPTWADVAPVLRGSCVGCHGWTATDHPPDANGVRAPNTGDSLRFDFYDWGADVCGDAALAGQAAVAADPSLTLAGSAAAAIQIASDIVPQNGARWPRMPPQPSPALAGWELDTILAWTSQPIKGPPPPGNRPPTIAVSQFPAAANGALAFTAIIDDPDADSVIGVVEVAGEAFLMNRPGSFDVQFDSSAWPAGTVYPIAVLCDGWTNASYDLGPINVHH